MISLEEIKEKQEELNKMIEEYNKQNLKWDKNWKPEDYEEYCYINNYGEVYPKCNETIYDEKIIKHNRVFQTEEQAEKWLEIDTYLREKSFEPNWNDFNQTEWFIYYSFKNKKFMVECNYQDYLLNLFHFENRDVCYEILEKYSQKELEFYFNIGE